MTMPFEITKWPAQIDRWLTISFRRRLLEEHLTALEFNYVGRVLEVGAGRSGRRGTFQPKLANDACLFQVDLRKVNTPHVQADLEALPFADGVMDTAICLEVLEYLENPEKGIMEFFRVMKENSLLVLSTPFMHRQDAPNDYWRFSEAGLHMLLNRNGFVEIRSNHQGEAFVVIANILKFRVQKIRNARFRLWIGLLAYPVICAIGSLDQGGSNKNRVMSTFTTGHLTMARKGPKQ